MYKSTLHKLSTPTLRELLKEHSYESIGRMCHCSRQAVHQLCLSRGLVGIRPRKHRARKVRVSKRVLEILARQFTLDALANVCGVSYTTMRNTLLGWGISYKNQRNTAANV